MFQVGQIIKRRFIHDQYGGNRQSGICPSRSHPFIFIFSGSGGRLHGYKDQWLNEDVYSYTGEGQHGDMEFTRGNLALRDHLKNGYKVFLFYAIGKGLVKFKSELKFADCDYFLTHDTEGKERLGIKFFFKKAGSVEYDIPSDVLSSQNSDLVNEKKEIIQLKKPNETERKGLVTSRVGQGAYRKSILHRWNYKCAATNYNNVNVLIASHIVPWKDATDEQRLDVDNGLLLSPDFDALFDKHLISFDHRTGELIQSEELKDSKIELLGISGREKIRELNEGNKNYLKMHNLSLL